MNVNTTQHISFLLYTCVAKTSQPDENTVLLYGKTYNETTLLTSMVIHYTVPLVYYIVPKESKGDHIFTTCTVFFRRSARDTDWSITPVTMELPWTSFQHTPIDRDIKTKNEYYDEWTDGHSHSMLPSTAGGKRNCFKITVTNADNNLIDALHGRLAPYIDGIFDYGESCVDRFLQQHHCYGPTFFDFIPCDKNGVNTQLHKQTQVTCADNEYNINDNSRLIRSISGTRAITPLLFTINIWETYCVSTSNVSIMEYKDGIQSIVDPLHSWAFESRDVSPHVLCTIGLLPCSHTTGKYRVDVNFYIYHTTGETPYYYMHVSNVSAQGCIDKYTTYTPLANRKAREKAGPWYMILEALQKYNPDIICGGKDWESKLVRYLSGSQSHVKHALLCVLAGRSLHNEYMMTTPHDFHTYSGRITFDIQTYLRDNKMIQVKTDDYIEFIHAALAPHHSMELCGDPLCPCTTPDKDALFMIIKKYALIPMIYSMAVTTASTLQLICDGKHMAQNECLLNHACNSNAILKPQTPYEKKRHTHFTQLHKIAYTGGYVAQPTNGLHEYVVDLDFRSMYPSIVQEGNLCFLTIHQLFDNQRKRLHEEDTIDTSVKNRSVRPTRQGIIPLLAAQASQRRKELLDTTNNNQIITKALQYALKLVINSVIGVPGCYYSRYYHPLLAQTITRMGRMILLDVIEYATTCGFKVVYGDTDSLMIKVPMLELLEHVNNPSIIEYIQHRASPICDYISQRYHVMRLVQQGIFECCCIIGKKNYCGLFYDPILTLANYSTTTTILSNDTMTTPPTEVSLLTNTHLYDTFHGKLKMIGFPFQTKQTPRMMEYVTQHLMLALFRYTVHEHQRTRSILLHTTLYHAITREIVNGAMQRMQDCVQCTPYVYMTHDKRNQEAMLHHGAYGVITLTDQLTCLQHPIEPYIFCDDNDKTVRYNGTIHKEYYINLCCALFKKLEICSQVPFDATAILKQFIVHTIVPHDEVCTFYTTRNILDTTLYIYNDIPKYTTIICIECMKYTPFFEWYSRDIQDIFQCPQCKHEITGDVFIRLCSMMMDDNIKTYKDTISLCQTTTACMCQLVRTNNILVVMEYIMNSIQTTMKSIPHIFIQMRRMLQNSLQKIHYLKNE